MWHIVIGLIVHYAKNSYKRKNVEIFVFAGYAQLCVTPAAVFLTPVESDGTQKVT